MQTAVQLLFAVLSFVLGDSVSAQTAADVLRREPIHGLACVLWVQGQLTG